MAEDLKRFIFEEKANHRRFSSNINSIIAKYDRHFADDAEVDLITLRTYNNRDENVIRKLRPKPIGYTQFLSTKRKELSESLVYESCITDDNSSQQNTTIQGSPPNRYSPIFEGNFLKRSSSFYQEPDSATEDDDSEFLALKTSYSEIISDKNDEPSDAETLTSHSSDDIEVDYGDSSEDSDDEDSWGDVKVLPQFQTECNNAFISLSSTEERRDAVDQELLKEKEQRLENKSVMDKNKILKEMQKQIYCLKAEIECAQIENSKKMDSSITFDDEIDGDFPVRCTDKSGYCHRDKLSSRKQQTNHADKDDKLPQYKNYENIKSWRDQKYEESYQQNKRIEEWVGTTNVETGINQAYYDKYLMECKGDQSPDQTYLVTGKSDTSDRSQRDVYFGYEKGNPVQRVNEKQSLWGLSNSNVRKDNQHNQPRRIVPALTKTSAGRKERKTVTEPLEQEFHKEFSPRKYSVRGTSYNAVSTEDSPVGADIDRNDSAKLNSRNVIAKFASPEKKVGVAAKMYSKKTKTNNFDEATEKKAVQEGKTLNALPIETRLVHVKRDQRCSLLSVKSQITDDNEDIFIVEDDFDHVKKPHNSNFSRHPISGLTINNKVSQSVPALRMKDVEFIDKTNTKHNKNKILRFNTSSKREAPILSSKQCTRDQREIYSCNNFVKSDSRTKLSSKYNIDDHCKDHTVKTTDQSKTILSLKDTQYHQPKTFLFEKDKNVGSQFSSKLYVPTKQLQKTVKRKFVPHEDTANLLELMLQRETKVATFLSPKAFHKKFDKPIHTDIKPVAETLRCLSAARNMQTFEYESKLTNGNVRRNWNNKSVQSEIHYSNHRPFSVPTFKRSGFSSQKVDMDNDFNTLHNVWDREPIAVGDDRELPMLQSSSPYRSAKDLSSIALYAKSSFSSPDLQKNRQGVMYSQDMSKSVPAKLQLKSNIETFSPPPENKFQLFCRTKLKAKRSQQLFENENVSGVTESNERQFNQDQPFSGKFHTPSKRDPYNYSSVTVESPSTVFSRMVLNTPSPGCRKHTEKFGRFKPQIEVMTQPVDANCKQITDGHIFKKPFSYFENSRGKNGANGQFYQQSRSNNRYENYVESQNMTSAYKDDCKNDRYYTGNEHFFNTEVKYTDKENSKNRKDMNLVKTNINYKRETVSGRESGRSNTEFKYTDKENSKYRKETNLVKVNYRKETVSGRGCRRKALFQSTPMKSSGMFKLDNTMSTIHGSISDEEESDCEVMTISD